ncbi:UNVERIFIED_CONTAM: hypothetical protein FKN15_015737 [Acipenser sinensis]
MRSDGGKLGQQYLHYAIFGGEKGEVFNAGEGHYGPESPDGPVPGAFVETGTCGSCRSPSSYTAPIVIPSLPQGTSGWMEEASQLAQEDTLSIAAFGDGAFFSSDMQVGGKPEPPAKEEPGFEVASEASAPPLSSSVLELMGRSAAFLQVPWMAEAEPRLSMFRTQAIAPCPQKFPAFLDFMEEVPSLHLIICDSCLRIDTNQRFVFNSLTNEESRNNWQKYGNPDGPQATSFGIALPAWIVDQKNSMLVLLVYGLAFMVILPVVVGTWWYRSIRYSGDQILINTTQLFMHFMYKTPNMNMKRLGMVLTAAFEFDPRNNKEATIRPTDNTEVPQLIRDLGNINVKKKEPPFCYPYSLKARVLMLSHLARMEVSENTEEDQRFVVRKIPALLQEMINVGCQLTMMANSRGGFHAPRLVSIENCMKLSQMIVQGLQESKSPLLQLPHFEEEHLRYCVSKKYKVRSILDLVSLKDSDRRSMLRFLGEEKYDEVMAVLGSFPNITVDIKLQVLDDEDSHNITAGSIVTVTVTLTRKRMLDFFEKEQEQVCAPEDPITEEGQGDIGKNKSKVWQNKNKAAKKTSKSKKKKLSKKKAPSQPQKQDKQKQANGTVAGNEGAPLTKEEEDEVSDKGSDSEEGETNKDSPSERDDESDKQSDTEPDEMGGDDEEPAEGAVVCGLNTDNGSQFHINTNTGPMSIPAASVQKPDNSEMQSPAMSPAFIPGQRGKIPGRKRGRPPLRSTVSKMDFQNRYSESLSPLKVPKKRGRKPGFKLKSRIVMTPLAISPPSSTPEPDMSSFPQDAATVPHSVTPQVLTATFDGKQHLLSLPVVNSIGYVLRFLKKLCRSLHCENLFSDQPFMQHSAASYHSEKYFEGNAHSTTFDGKQHLLSLPVVNSIGYVLRFLKKLCRSLHCENLFSDQPFMQHSAASYHSEKYFEGNAHSTETSMPEDYLVDPIDPKRYSVDPTDSAFNLMSSPYPPKPSYGYRSCQQFPGGPTPIGLCRQASSPSTFQEGNRSGVWLLLYNYPIPEETETSLYYPIPEETETSLYYPIPEETETSLYYPIPEETETSLYYPIPEETETSLYYPIPEETETSLYYPIPEETETSLYYPIPEETETSLYYPIPEETETSLYYPIPEETETSLYYPIPEETETSLYYPIPEETETSLYYPIPEETETSLYYPIPEETETSLYYPIPEETETWQINCYLCFSVLATMCH